MISSKAPLTPPEQIRLNSRVLRVCPDCLSSATMPVEDILPLQKKTKRTSPSIKRSSGDHKDAHARPLRLLVSNHEKEALINKSKWEILKRCVSNLSGKQNPSKCNHVMLFCPWKTPASTSLADKWQNALEYLETMNATRPCTVCFTQWVCCFTYKLQTCSLKMWFDHCQKICWTVLRFFFEQNVTRQKFCTVSLGNICPRERRRGPELPQMHEGALS